MFLGSHFYIAGLASTLLLAFLSVAHRSPHLVAVHEVMIAWVAVSTLAMAGIVLGRGRIESRAWVLVGFSLLSVSIGQLLLNSGPGFLNYQYLAGLNSTLLVIGASLWASRCRG